jgi:hypothetical protein
MAFGRPLRDIDETAVLPLADIGAKEAHIMPQASSVSSSIGFGGQRSIANATNGTVHHIKSESQPTTAINTNGSTILAINGAMSSKLVIA